MIYANSDIFVAALQLIGQKWVGGKIVDGRSRDDRSSVCPVFFLLRSGIYAGIVLSSAMVRLSGLYTEDFSVSRRSNARR